jgi:uncharacterized membrane protein
MTHFHRETESSTGHDLVDKAPGRSAALASGERQTDGQSRALRRTAQGLGWFSVGLGLAELLAPRQLGRFVGVRDNPRARLTLRAMGLRDLAAGTGILVRPRPAGWMWARVAGDAIDLALLGLALGGKRANRSRIPAAIASVAGVTALDLLVSTRLSRARRQTVDVARERALTLTRAVTVSRSPDQLYAFWRNFQNLPSFMNMLQEVQIHDDRRSRWTARDPGGKSVEWEAEITDERPGESIGWRTLEGAPLPHRAEVRFRKAPGGRGTEVIWTLKLEPPRGLFRGTVARLLKVVPATQIENDLRRFKQVMEVGEVVCSDASVHDGPHPARPPSDDEIG